MDEHKGPNEFTPEEQIRHLEDEKKRTPKDDDIKTGDRNVDNQVADEELKDPKEVPE